MVIAEDTTPETGADSDESAFAERRERMTLHAARLTALLDVPNINGVKQRLFRARYWHEAELLVVSLLQRFGVPDGTPALTVYVTRGYQHFPVHAPKLDLSGRYTVDEIVAFLELDTVDPATVEWRDETAYILVPDTVESVLRKVTG